MAPLKGPISVLLLVITTLFWSIPLILLTLLKLITPTRALRLIVLRGLNGVALNWIGCNLWWMRHWLKPQLDATLPEGLSPEQRWLVISNHRSWTDIFMLLMVLHRRIPMPRFFLKQQLIWIPIVGLAWWALEYPFMRRYSREQIARRPQLADIDRKATELMCKRAREMPLAIFNFVEGTRFTPAKRDAQNSPFRHLLRPKAGGIAQVLSHLGEQLDGILDVTLHYENPQPTFWGFLCGREGRITLDARRLDVPEWMLDSRYHDDPHYKERFHTWLNALWQEKDQALDSR
ncbi:acyltransferase [Halomonas sp. MCCC 1A11062]|uniref:acyltransferase n=1 Tax=Halomonas sp. MCCC 1A11062 TaxID=2733485 RepID=UPI001F1F7603|nr:acyltransferase [Halomonas sp. MCCC 1A11062]MCE8039253.1 acyltransferase [Halomonas sp. MCCC 1A11062]